MFISNRKFESSRSLTSDKQITYPLIKLSLQNCLIWQKVYEVRSNMQYSVLFSTEIHLQGDEEINKFYLYICIGIMDHDSARRYNGSRYQNN